MVQDQPYRDGRWIEHTLHYDKKAAMNEARTLAKHRKWPVRVIEL